MRKKETLVHNSSTQKEVDLMIKEQQRTVDVWFCASGNSFLSRVWSIKTSAVILSVKQNLMWVIFLYAEGFGRGRTTTGQVEGRIKNWI